MSRSFSVHGLRSVDLSPKFCGISKAVLQAQPSKLLSHGHPGQCQSDQPCRCERESRLAHLCRVRSIADWGLLVSSMPRTILGWIWMERSTPLDSTTISLCLALFPVGRLSRDQGSRQDPHRCSTSGARSQRSYWFPDGLLHRCQYPRSVQAPDPGAFYVMDRAYVDFKRLFAINQGRCFLCHLEQRSP